ncbi:MAG TPA: hypothetical protein DCL54_14015 [Alphaproteobacteria bacterium]|nr:hypothetical protein [Alphaproteobacteria bacterium]HAJ47686.1 hypothetical protein [Alphaproteobacteria bacterium]
MIIVFKRWWGMMLAILALQIGNGVSGITISLRSEAAGFDANAMGWIIGVFFLGSAAGSLAPPWVLRWTGLTGAFIVFTLIAGGSVAGFTFTDDPVAWMMLRFAQGFGLSAMFATAESWLNLATGNDWRARTFAVYIMMQLLGLAAGQLGVSLGDITGAAGLATAALLMTGSSLFLIAARHSEPSVALREPLNPIALTFRAPLGACVIAISGFMWALVVGLGPVFAERSGLSTTEVSVFTAIAVLGGLIAQFPLGHWADHSDRRMVLAFMGSVAAAFALAGALVPQPWAITLFLISCVVGAMTFPVYAVAASLVNEVLAQEERVAASAAMVLYFGLGATLAPVLGAQAMAIAGPHAFFLAAALVCAAQALLLSLRSWDTTPH